MARRPLLRSGLAAVALTAAAGAAHADEVLLQWFENSWNQVENRMPDFFLAGYSGTWIPPVMQPGDPSSPGFDQFNKFDAGTPNDPTIYGTEADLKAAIDEFHAAGANVYVDTILNHAAGRSTSNFFLYDQGGYPGFWSGPRGFGDFKQPTEDWGDFHAGNSNGFLQSENPGGFNYDLFNGDLVALIDIDQFSNNLFIRHPVDANDPLNIPGGTDFNVPDPDNARFYPDLDLAPKVFTNPANGQQYTIYPFNTADPMQGDPVVEAAGDLLMRHSQWMLEEFEIDGFRLDAIKHVPQSFWNDSWDAAVFDRWKKPDGTTGTPFSFGEAVADNNFISQFTRKDGFGNRDALDLNGAGRLREVVNARGFNSWQTVLDQHLDNVDGFNNGSLGVNHLYSHDNGSAGDGGNAPAIPADDRAGWHAFAYLLMRPGPAIVYYNSREMHDRFAFRGFWPREGNPEALGLDKDGSTLNDTLTKLVTISNEYARGDFILLTSNNSDVMIFERRQGSSGRGNVVVGVNDRYDAGFDTRTVGVGFPPGTVLVELTGNADDPQVDPGGDIPSTITVGASGAVTLRVPRNSSSVGEHNKGYVIYGPANPDATMSVAPVAQTLQPSPPTTARWGRVLSTAEIITAPAMTIEIVTSAAPFAGSNTDDNALFRFGRGFDDLNNNGGVDITGGEFSGWEQFLDVNTPLFSNPGLTNGLYRQTINTADLPEGFNYLNAVVFRQRSAGDAIYKDLREVVYIDTQAPDIALDSSRVDCVTGGGTLVITNDDQTVTDVWVFVDLPDGAPVPPLTSADKAIDRDRGRFVFPVSGLTGSQHTFTIVAHEAPRGQLVREEVLTFDETIGGLKGDLNADGVVNLIDLYTYETLPGATPFLCEADLDDDGDNDDDDIELLRQTLRTGEVTDIDDR
jgi:glycosidase